jgi:acyl-CoA thioesterase-1
MNRTFFLCILLLLWLPACRNQSTPAPESTPSPPKAGVQSTGSVPKIVAFGDSLTAGYGLAAQQTYPALLQERLRQDGYDYEVVNAGVSGDTSAGGVRRIDWALEGDVRILILQLGANDFLRGQPVAQTRKNLAAIIDRAQEKNVQVLLAGMLVPTSAGREYQEQIHNMFTDLAREKNVPLIPFFLEGVAGIHSLNLPDGIHPNTEGAKIVAETVYRYLKPLL